MKISSASHGINFLLISLCISWLLLTVVAVAALTYVGVHVCRLHKCKTSQTVVNR